MLAEDFVLGRMVSRVLGKRVVLARRPIQNVSVSRGVGDFLARYGRWAVLHRTVTGRLVHLSQVLPQPGAARGGGGGRRARRAHPGRPGRAVRRQGRHRRRLRPGPPARAASDCSSLPLVPLKDLVYGVAWARGLVRSQVDWRGTSIRVLAGTRIGAASPTGATGPLVAASRAS